MFGDLTFAGGTFSDFFTVAGQISYTFRKGRTAVMAIIPENGKILTDAPARIIRSKVEAPKTLNYETPSRIARTKVEVIKTVSTNPQTGM